MGKLSRNKGAAAEREVAKLFKKYGYSNARRLLSQYQQKNGCDLENTGPFIVQVKCGKHINFAEAFGEATSEAKKEEIPVAFCRYDRGEWLIVINEKTFSQIVQSLQGSLSPSSSSHQ